MRVPAECYQFSDELTVRFPLLRPAQIQGLALWVWGAIVAGSACQAAAVGVLQPLFASAHAARQYLREWLYDGAERAAPCQTTLAVEGCFVWLLRWVIGWWRGTQLPLAIDVTALGDRVVVLTVAVLYRGCAIPVAWRVLPANRQGTWLDALLELLPAVAPAVPPGWTVLVLTDRGLWTPQLWRQIRTFGWHPVMRIRPDALFAPLGHTRQRARDLIPGPGHAWVGAGTAFGDAAVRRHGTLVVVWECGQTEPWIVLTDLAVDEIGVAWYGLRVWVELGFRALKRLGWHWERTRRTDPQRVARHWLVLAVATLWSLSTGTRAEDAEWRGIAPANLRVCPNQPPPRRPRQVSVFTRGLFLLRWQLLRQRRLWTRHWLLPEAWPQPPPSLHITTHHTQPGTQP